MRFICGPNFEEENEFLAAEPPQSGAEPRGAGGVPTGQTQTGGGAERFPPGAWRLCPGPAAPSRPPAVRVWGPLCGGRGAVTHQPPEVCTAVRGLSEPCHPCMQGSKASREFLGTKQWNPVTLWREGFLKTCE